MLWVTGDKQRCDDRGAWRATVIGSKDLDITEATVQVVTEERYFKISILGQINIWKLGRYERKKEESEMKVNRNRKKIQKGKMSLIRDK